MFYFVDIMGEPDYLGQFEQLVLLAVLRLGADAYGVTIRQEIELRTGKAISIGATYATLDRLERKRYVRSWSGDPTPQRGGRSKRYFSVEAEGARALKHTLEAVGSMREGLQPVLGAI